MKIFFSVLGALLLFLVIIAGGEALDYVHWNFWAPKMEAARRDQMIQSREYSEATTRELYRLKLQYLQAKNDDERNTIRAFALHESAAFERDRLPLDIQAFITQLGG